MEVEIVEKLKHTFNGLNAENLNLIYEVYDSDLEFQDPVHKIRGIEDYFQYLKRMYQDTKYSHFDFEEDFHKPGEAVLIWVMHIEHPKLNGGKRYATPGVSHLRYKEKIYYHRDFFDTSEFLFERVPLLGNIPRWIKSRI